MKNKEPLYRKVNTTARFCHHKYGADYKHQRNKKNKDESMKQGVQRGLDYTPLFKFLLSRIGKNWDDVYSEAIGRLDKKDPIFYMVKPSKEEVSYFQCENAFFPTLFVNQDNCLEQINPNLTVNDFFPYCSCCTHTFNGKPLTNKPQT